ncbi:DUF1799 domain-containing protein [Inquilinus limosus]|uniref:DUF1799 domain-containing protein n=1 Tax=Inquilinus limosus TaxID=171674 RepID=UPI0007E8D5E3
MIEAAQRWARGKPSRAEGEPEAIKDLRRLGATEAEIAEAKRRLGLLSTGDFGVFPENWPAVCAWSAVCTQWRTGAVPGGLGPGRILYLGLDYAGARAGLALASIDNTPELWAGLQIMEGAAIEELNRR